MPWRPPEAFLCTQGVSLDRTVVSRITNCPAAEEEEEGGWIGTGFEGTSWGGRPGSRGMVLYTAWVTNVSRRGRPGLERHTGIDELLFLIRPGALLEGAK